MENEKVKLKDTLKLKIIFAEYKGERIQITLPRNLFLEKPVMYVGGYISRVWMKKIKHQIIIEYCLYEEVKPKIVVFDLEFNFKAWDEILMKEPKIYEYFSLKLVI